MANKYHISPSSGRPNICTASVRDCPVGGQDEHYASKDEARAGYEKKMEGKTFSAVSKKDSNVVALGDFKAKKETKAAADLDAVREATGFDDALPKVKKAMISKADAKLLDDIAAGKKVTDEKIDKFLADHKYEETMGAYDSEANVSNAKNVFDYVRAVRATSGTPSTLPTLDTFDPATQTLFSNASARKNAFIAGKAIRREAAHAEWMYELASQHDASALSYASEGDKVAAERYRQSAANNRDEALKSEARVQAQLREIQHLHDTDDDFYADANITRMLSKGWFRPKANSFDNIYIGSVKKLK